VAGGEPHCPAKTDKRFASAPVRHADNDGSFIGERAATRGRNATEGGDERVGVPPWNAHGERRDQGRARSS